MRRWYGSVTCVVAVLAACGLPWTAAPGAAGKPPKRPRQAILHVLATCDGTATVEGRAKNSASRIDTTDHCRLTYDGWTRYEVPNEPGEALEAIEGDWQVRVSGGAKTVEVTDQGDGESVTITTGWTYRRGELPKEVAYVGDIVTGMTDDGYSIGLGPFPSAVDAVKGTGTWRSERVGKEGEHETQQGQLAEGVTLGEPLFCSSAIGIALSNPQVRGRLKLEGKLKPGQDSFRIASSAAYLHELKQATSPEDEMPLTITHRGNVFISYRLSYFDPQEVEAVLYPSPDEADWLPTAGRSGSAGATPMTVKVQLEEQGKPGHLAARRAKFRFELSGTSKQRGSCLNEPREGATERHGLRLDDNHGGLKVTPDGQSADSAGEINQWTAVVNCYDWGAWGKLKVTATLEDGKVLKAHLANDPGKEELALPLDENDNHIADSWETTQVDATWDAEEQSGNQHHGDGLTLYEEYRGLIVEGEHRQLSPDGKELVVENNLGGLGAAGLGRFQNAAGITVVELAPGELPQSRQVNLNHGFAHTGDQFGVPLISGAFTDPATFAMAMPNRPHPSPKDCDEVRVRADLAGAYTDPAVIAASKREILTEMTWAIAHELAHALSVQHHGDEAEAQKVALGANAPAAVYGEDGQPLAKPITIQGPIGGYQGPGSGDVDCLMCYTGVYKWVRQPGPAFHAVPKIANGEHFCRKPAGTGYNSSQNGQVALFGDASHGRGNCLARMQLKDY